MEIKTIDEYILMEMTEENSEVSMRAMKCATTEEYVVKKLVEMEDKNEKLKDENWMLADKNKKLSNEIATLKEEIETLKKENKSLRETLKNCGKKIRQVTKVLENNLELKLNNGAEDPAISVKIDVNNFDDFGNYDYDYFYDHDDVDLDALNYVDYGNSDCEDEED